MSKSKPSMVKVEKAFYEFIMGEEDLETIEQAKKAAETWFNPTGEPRKISGLYMLAWDEVGDWSWEDDPMDPPTSIEKATKPLISVRGGTFGSRDPMQYILIIGRRKKLVRDFGRYANMRISIRYATPRPDTVQKWAEQWLAETGNNY